MIVSVFRFTIAEAERTATGVADHRNIFDPTKAHLDKG